MTSALDPETERDLVAALVEAEIMRGQYLGAPFLEGLGRAALPVA